MGKVRKANAFYFTAAWACWCAATLPDYVDVEFVDENMQPIARTLAELTKEVVADMQDEGYRTKTITIKI